MWLHCSLVRLCVHGKREAGVMTSSCLCFSHHELHRVLSFKSTGIASDTCVCPASLRLAA